MRCCTVADAYTVDPSALRDTAARLEDALGVLANVRRAPVQAVIGGRAWGALGEEFGVPNRYDALVIAATAAVEHADRYLGLLTGSLMAAADGYEAQELGSTDRLNRADRLGSTDR
jgi:hypothetical protein